MAEPYLLALPPELLLLSLSYLDVRSLLSFSTTSRYGYSLAKSSFHTLSFSIHPTSLSQKLSSISQMGLSPITSTTSVFAPSKLADIQSGCYTPPLFPQERTSSLLLPASKEYGCHLLNMFATSLTESILTRYAISLRNLNLVLLGFDRSTAAALSKMLNLQVLSIRIENSTFRVPGRWKASLKVEEIIGWTLLKQNASWRRLSALRLENAEISTNQLTSLLEGVNAPKSNRYIRSGKGVRELWLNGCPRVGKEIWRWMGREWKANTSLEVLTMDACGGDIDEEICGWIERLKGLKFLSVTGVRGLPQEEVDNWNSEKWHIPQLIIPYHHGDDEESDIIEVDPAYL